MPNVALVPERATKIPLLELVVDGFPRTRHKYTVETGGHPVEDGVLVQDHAVARAERLELSGIVSDQAGPDNPDGTGTLTHVRAAAAAEELRRLHRETVIVEVVTALGTYPEMIITSCEIDETGAGIEFELKLGQVLRVGREPGEIVADTAGEAAAERTSLASLGLVSQLPPSALSAAFSNTGELVAPELVDPLVDVSAQAAQNAADLLGTPAGRAVLEQAQDHLLERVQARLQQEVASRAGDYVRNLTSRTARALFDARIGAALRQVAGVTGVDVESSFIERGVKLRAAVTSTVGDVIAEQRFTMEDLRGE